MPTSSLTLRLFGHKGGNPALALQLQGPVVLSLTPVQWGFEPVQLLVSTQMNRQRWGQDSVSTQGAT